MRRGFPAFTRSTNMPIKNKLTKQNTKRGFFAFNNDQVPHNAKPSAKILEHLAAQASSLAESAKELAETATPLSERTGELKERLGQRFEQVVGGGIENSSFEAPILETAPAGKTWYRVPLEDAGAISGDGSEYHVYLKKGFTNNLCIFLSGGGVAWNEYTASHPTTGAAVAAFEPNYYWNNLRPFTQVMNINVGITENQSPRNPFDDWSFIVIAYSTGDFHVGNNDFHYKGEDGEDHVLHFHGHENVKAALDGAKKWVPNPQKLLIAGDSAGAFAVPAVAGMIADDYYPSVSDITLFSDSALLLYKKWRKTAKEIWHAPDDIVEAMKTDNIVLDWYRALYEKYEGRFRYLYASSSHDYLLSTYYNDLTKKTFKTDADVQEAYYEQLKVMAKELKLLRPDFGFFFYDWKNLTTKGGTIHTCVRQPYFYMKTKSGVTMAKWLFDAVNGNIYDIGAELLLT